ncbi:MAG TPA: M20 aminoacylase family protein [Pseudolabrys sp.]|nr:M20 aminoacylase family protein [Pseudolabrys sp.]
MPIVNRVADLHADITAWRRDLHANPEILYEVHRTAATVADKLKAFGCDEVVTGLGRTGVVGVIRGRKGKSERTIGLRADMDALPITEATGLPYKSTAPGKMHACGHDGHTAMLLGAARYLAETRNFNGTAVVIFQPAEEGGAGGKAMCDDGLMTRFGIDEVYGMHNSPNMPIGSFGLRPGPIMAAADYITVVIEGHGGHAARPHLTIDPVVIGCHTIIAMQSVVSRNTDPLKSAVVSVTMFEAGTADNVIPQRVQLDGTVRTLDEDVRVMVEQRLGAIVEHTAAAFGAKAKFTYRRNYPVLVNHEKQTAFAADVASEVAGEKQVNRELVPMMGAEDFSFMLNERPGAFIWVGNGPSAGLHHPEYNFNDEAIPFGTSYWVRLVETALRG